MAWSSPFTWTTGLTISGSTDAASASVSLNYQLTGNLLSARNLWDNAIHLSLEAHQSIPNNANTSVVWEHIDWQAGNSTIWASASGAQLKVTVAGIWEGLGSLEWSHNDIGRRTCGIRVNGTTVYRCGAQCATINSGDGVNQPYGDVFQLTTADSIEVMAIQESGDALDLRGAGPDRTRFSWRLLGAAS